MPVGTHSGREQGAWFQINAVADTIKLKEAKGMNATFERDLLKAWSKYPGYEAAKEALAKIDKGG